MDLLQGYGSSDSDNDSMSSSVQLTSQNKPAAAKPTSKIQLSTTKRGKRILSLGAVLPPEIFDRLTRPADADDSSTSSFEDGCDKRVDSKKRKRAKDGDENVVTTSKPSNNGNSVNRTELNSFLSELRSAPMEKKDRNDTKSSNHSQNNKIEKLGMAFMSYTETKHDSNEVVDVHAAKPSAVRPTTTGDANLQRKSAASSLTFSRISTAAPVPLVNNDVSMPQHSSATSYNNIHEYHVPQETKQQMNVPMYSSTTANDDYTASNTMIKSRKQRREEERALRSGSAFQAATEINQPSPTEFAPTAHAAAIASRAARFRGAGSGNGGGGSVKNISMYDPKAGGDVAGQGITGKHRSKHQINSLMANAISLEAHRAAESELARIGGGQRGGSSRADAKRKYGW